MQTAAKQKMENTYWIGWCRQYMQHILEVPDVKISEIKQSKAQIKLVCQ